MTENDLSFLITSLQDSITSISLFLLKQQYDVKKTRNDFKEFYSHLVNWVGVQCFQVQKFYEASLAEAEQKKEPFTEEIMESYKLCARLCLENSLLFSSLAIGHLKNCSSAEEKIEIQLALFHSSTQFMALFYRFQAVFEQEGINVYDLEFDENRVLSAIDPN